MTIDPMINTIRETLGRVIYTHKVHEKQREKSSFWGTTTKWINISLIALTSGGFITSEALGDNRYFIASIVVATLSLAFSIYQLSFDPVSNASAQRSAAKSFLVIRDQYINLLSDAMSGLDAESVRQRRDEIQESLNAAHSNAPNTSRRAYAAAKKALQVEGEMSFGEAELNALLPASLRVTSSDEPTQTR